MIKITNISMALLMVSGISVASDKMYQKFGIKSGKITYKITGSMSMMGVNSKTLGKKESDIFRLWYQRAKRRE